MDDISRNIDQRLRDAYLATNYEVQHLGLRLRIGEENWDMEEFLIDNNVFSWAYVSAYNPYSKPLSNTENENRHAKMLDFVKKQKWVFAEGYGVPQNNDWEPEKSLLLLDISRDEAINLGKMFDQNAIVLGRLGKAPELFFL